VEEQKEVIEELYRPGTIEKSNASYQKILKMKMKMKKNKINKIFMKNLKIGNASILQICINKNIKKLREMKNLRNQNKKNYH